MPRCSICILFRPRLYADLLARLLTARGDISLVYCNPQFCCTHPGCSSPYVSVYLLSLDEYNNPELALLPSRMAEAKIIAFSPSGQLGMVREAGQTAWETLRPFSLSDIIEEIHSACQTCPPDDPTLIKGRAGVYATQSTP